MESKDWILVIGPLVGVLVGGGITSVAKFFELRHQSKIALSQWRIERLEELSEKLAAYIFELDMLPSRVVNLPEQDGDRGAELAKYFGIRAEIANKLLAVVSRLPKYLPGKYGKITPDNTGGKMYKAAKELIVTLQKSGASETELDASLNSFLDEYSEHQDYIVTLEIAITGEIRKVLEERTLKQWFGVLGNGNNPSVSK